jgi:hypothetical protein
MEVQGRETGMRTPLELSTLRAVPVKLPLPDTAVIPLAWFVVGAEGKWFIGLPRRQKFDHQPTLPYM